MTEWREVVGFPDYAVSEDGEIMRVRSDLRGHALTQVPLVTRISPSGYLSVTLCANAKKKNVRVNRIVCEAFHGPPPSSRHHAAHEDGLRINNAASNLSWKTPRQNEADKIAHGTNGAGERHWSKSKPECRPKGSGHGLARLTEEVIPAIRKDPRPNAAIAATYGVHKATIGQVKACKTWRHV